MIKDLELKLSGELPVNRVELITLVDSWGRKDSLSTDDDLDIKKCDANERYNLSNLDISQIEDLSYIFIYSPFNGDLSKWDVSSCKNMYGLFYYSKFNNNSISNWDISNVKKLSYIFGLSVFDGDTNEFKKKTAFLFKFFNEIFISLKQCGLNYDFVHKINSSDRQNYQTIMFDNKVLIRINKSKLSYFYSSWNINNDVECFAMFQNNVVFRTKYNSGEEVSNSSKNILKWFEENREKMKEINNPKQEVLDFFSFDSNKELDK